MRFFDSWLPQSDLVLTCPPDSSSPTPFDDLVLNLFIGSGVLTFPLLYFVVAPYGKFSSRSYGPQINGRLAWILMEIVSPIVFLVWFVLGVWNSTRKEHTLVGSVFLVLWLYHYLYRSIVYPCTRPKMSDSNIPVVLSGVFFNLMNGFLNARFITCFSNFDFQWFKTTYFFVGLFLFFFGLYLNRSSDDILRKLRENGGTGYKLPHGGGFTLVSSPHYLGEIIEWCGFSMATGFTRSSVYFVLWTAFNLIPRAVSQHKWYKEKFSEEMPRERRAIIPFLY